MISECIMVARCSSDVSSDTVASIPSHVSRSPFDDDRLSGRKPEVVGSPEDELDDTD